MELYIITANTYLGGWGAEISVFGVFDSLKLAQDEIEKLKKKNNYKYQITKMKLNKTKKIYLGGYIE